MPPNAKPFALSRENELLTPDDKDSLRNATSEFLDSQADTNGLKSYSNDAEDWTDVKHSERKKRDRILDDGVLLSLMKKSDYKGFERLFLNLSIMALTHYGLRQLVGGPQELMDNLKEDPMKAIAFPILYLFYGFQFQCFAFAGQHEFLHRNAWKTKWINDFVLFLTGVFCFELGAHERVMHKQHHTFTNNIDKDPELTSNFTREELEAPGFRNVPSTRWAYLMGFLDILSTFKCRVGRIVFSALGVAVDYSGTGWSLENWKYSDDSGIMRSIQRTAIAQLTIYAAVIYFFGQTQEQLMSLAFWWWCPVLVGYPAVNYCRNLEHADCEVSKISNNLRNTRTCRTNLLMRILLWDTNFHAEHHCYPMVPFFNLHKINQLTHDHIIHNECNYFTTEQIEAIKPNGWIDKQARLNKAGAKAE